MKGIFKCLQGLESFVVLNVPHGVISIVATAEKVGVRIRWLDKVIGDICALRDHLVLIQREE